jgi:hypothetical protein
LDSGDGKIFAPISTYSNAMIALPLQELRVA